MSTWEQRGEQPLPVPQLPEEFVADFIDRASQTEAGDSVGLVSMQLAAQRAPELSLVHEAIGALIAAKRRGVDARLLIDERYVANMTRINNRDYPNWLPMASRVDRLERQRVRQRTDVWLAELTTAGVVVGRQPQVNSRGYVPRLRQAGSFHVAQKPFATVHTKAAYVAHKDDETTAWLTTANLTDADYATPRAGDGFGMHNLALRLEGQGASFVMKAVTGGFNREAGIHTFGDRVKLVHDVGNNGEPARLPRILAEALEAIDPRRVSQIIDPHDAQPKSPKAIALISQYAPNGLLYNALEYAATIGEAFVSLPLEPSNDHRSKSFPYNLNTAWFRRRADQLPPQTMHLPTRVLSSHVKALVVTYHDGTAKLIIGSDNFVTNLQKVVRNEELSVSIDLDCKRPREARYLRDVVELVSDIGEIDALTRQKLLADVHI